MHQPTYYQLTAFINILGDQFSKISACPFLTAEYVTNDLKLFKLREIIIKNLIKLTEYFTKGAFHTLLDQQDQTEKILTTGAITAGVGTVGGVVGNALINHTDKKTNNSNN